MNFFKDYLKPYAPIFGNDWLIDDSHLKEIVPGVHSNNNPHWDNSWNDELFFWLNPPLHSLEQTETLKLTSEQRRHAEPNSGHYRLRGIAGSGKTQVLAYRAAKLASQNYRVLIVTFNITLWHFIRDMIHRAPFEFRWKDEYGKPYITFNHFHGLCKDILNQFDVKWPDGEGPEFFKKTVVDEVKKTIEKHKNDYEKWDAILIDEGQDYYWEWYNLLCGFLSSHDELLFIIDERQNIYDRDLGWCNSSTDEPRFDGKMIMRKVKFRGPWRILDRIFRLPKKVANYANLFSNMFNLQMKTEVFPTVEPLTLFNRQYEPHVVWKEISEDEVVEKMWKVFEFLKRKNIVPSDIVFLFPDKNIGMKCVKHFENNNINVNHVFVDNEYDSFHNNKKSFWRGDSRLKMSTIHSFKGWESFTVVIYIPPYVKPNEKIFDRIIYTAITRTRENLIIYNTNPRYVEFGKKVPTSWNE